MNNDYEVIISNSSLNSYGTRVMTDGMDIDQFSRNPIMLYMHWRDCTQPSAIGTVGNVHKDGDNVVGLLHFDDVTDLSKNLHAQWDAGTLKMVSASIEIIATDESPEVLLPGQTWGSIVKSKLQEVSVVDMGANDDAIALYYKGERLDLAKDKPGPLKLLKDMGSRINNNSNQENMDKKIVCLTLGLPDTATDEQINEKLKLMKANEDKVKALEKEKESLELAQITSTVETAVSEKKINADKKEEFISLGKKVGNGELKKIFSAMHSAVKPSNIIDHEKDGGSLSAYKALSEVPQAELMELRKDDPETYKKLYKAEFGIECPELKKVD